MDKRLTFFANIGAAVGAMFAVGSGSAELSDILFDSEAITSGVSTVCSYVAGAGSFVLLNARANYDQFVEEGKFKYKEYGKDLGKLFAGTSALKAIYFLGKPSLTYAFQKQGLDPSEASVAADAICVPVYLAAMYPIAKKFTRFMDMDTKNQSLSLDVE